MKQTRLSHLLSIGRLARQTGVSVRAIRHYDDNGLLSCTRADNGYRLFPPAAVTQVKQIQRLITIGFSLSEIATFPCCMLLIEGSAICPDANPAHRQRLAAIERQIEDLEHRRQALIRTLCEGDTGQV